MRDQIKDKSYFVTFLSKLENLDRQTEEKIASGSVKPDRVLPARLSMINSLIRRISAKYSSGMSPDQLLKEYFEATDLISTYWPGNCKFIGKKREILDQYSLGNYDTMLWMFSLGYLLDVSIVQFEKLVNVIDQDQVKDKLFEFITSAKIPNRPKLKEESYKHGWKLFGKLREATETEDKAKAESLIKAFLEKDWYKEHKNAGWYDNHKGKHDTYSGYWCFEAAAVTCIKGLDDSTYRDQQYYPKDLADYYRANH
ncbi:PoNe immunity protein domain-containing protein [Roseivirga sp. BDSF3-8]|uniref:PoNe immunity protein domain-containing protein n=1 Tax=Roseivirga sp. BDSF3-8 TaxID=3241598 RepID=UPI003532660D